MTKRNRILFRIAGAVLLTVLAGACIYLNSLMPIITGYAAKNLASAVFISGREPADVEALDLNFSLIKFTRNRVDYENRTVTSRFLWGKSVAAYREGYGVTLLRGKELSELQEEVFPLPSRDPLPETLVPGDSLLTARLAPIARSLVDEQAYNGTPFAFLVLNQGDIVAERYRHGIGANTPLLSWSMGKSVVNAITGIMSGDGLVYIYAPVDIPEWQNDARKEITLDQLLHMQSGLEWNENYGTRSDVNLMLHREADMGMYALSKPLEHKPGTHWYYSSGTTNIVMRYLADKFASDTEFLSYLRERLFIPLGVSNVHFEHDISGTPVGSSYLYMTARDFARFGQLFLNDGCYAGKRILPEHWVEYTVSPASDSDGAYGAFFWLNLNGQYPDAPADMFCCFGHDGQRIFIIPSRDTVVVLLGYSPKPDHEVRFNDLLRDILAVIP